MVDFIKNCIHYQIFFILVNLLMTIISIYKIGTVIITAVDENLTDPDQTKQSIRKKNNNNE